MPSGRSESQAGRQAGRQEGRRQQSRRAGWAHMQVSVHPGSRHPAGDLRLCMGHPAAVRSQQVSRRLDVPAAGVRLRSRQSVLHQRAARCLGGLPALAEGLREAAKGSVGGAGAPVSPAGRARCRCPPGARPALRGALSPHAASAPRQHLTHARPPAHLHCLDLRAKRLQAVRRQPHAAGGGDLGRHAAVQHRRLQAAGGHQGETAGHRLVAVWVCAHAGEGTGEGKGGGGGVHRRGGVTRCCVPRQRARPSPLLGMCCQACPPGAGARPASHSSGQRGPAPSALPPLRLCPTCSSGTSADGVENSQPSKVARKAHSSMRCCSGSRPSPSNETPSWGSEPRPAAPASAPPGPPPLLPLSLPSSFPASAADVARSKKLRSVASRLGVRQRACCIACRPSRMRRHSRRRACTGGEGRCSRGGRGGEQRWDPQAWASGNEFPSQRRNARCSCGRGGAGGVRVGAQRAAQARPATRLQHVVAGDGCAVLPQGAHHASVLLHLVEQQAAQHKEARRRRQLGADGPSQRQLQALCLRTALQRREQGPAAQRVAEQQGRRPRARPAAMRSARSSRCHPLQPTQASPALRTAPNT